MKPRITRPTRIALIAHDKEKEDMIALAGQFREFLVRCTLTATGATGARLINELDLVVDCKHSGTFGGDLEIAAQVVTGGIDCVIFLRDPMTAQSHEPDINALLHVCDMHNIVCATNISTARLVLRQLMTSNSKG